MECDVRGRSLQLGEGHAAPAPAGGVGGLDERAFDLAGIEAIVVDLAERAVLAERVDRFEALLPLAAAEGRSLEEKLRRAGAPLDLPFLVARPHFTFAGVELHKHFEDALDARLGKDLVP